MLSLDPGAWAVHPRRSFPSQLPPVGLEWRRYSLVSRSLDKCVLVDRQIDCQRTRDGKKNPPRPFLSLEVCSTYNEKQLWKFLSHSWERANIWGKNILNLVGEGQKEQERRQWKLIPQCVKVIFLLILRCSYFSMFCSKLKLFALNNICKNNCFMWEQAWIFFPYALK